MSDERAAAAIRATVGHDWSILDALAAKKERELRRILRSHREVSLTTDEVDLMRVRRTLDDALDRLMLGGELGVDTQDLE